MKKILILLILMCINLFGENEVLTSIQSTYSISKYLTKDTGIEVVSVFESDVAMDFGKSAFDNKDIDLSVAKNAVAVVDVAKVWEKDYLYEYARRENIRIVEIDSSYSFSGEDYLVLSLLNYKNGERNPYVWLSFQNANKMAQIIVEDLIKLFPEYESLLYKNLHDYITELKEMEDKYLEESLQFNTMKVISLTENLDYLFNELNLFVNHVDFNDINVENIPKLMKENNTKIFVSDRWVKKEIIEEIKKHNGQFLVLHTFNIPIDLDEKMDPDGYFDGMKENINKIVEALK